MTVFKMHVIHPKRYLFRRFEVGEDDSGCLFRLYGLRVGIRSWFHRMLYGRDDVCEFGVYRDRIELKDGFQKTVISSRLEKFESGWGRTYFGTGCAAVVLAILLLTILSHGGNFLGICFVAAIGYFVWHVFRRSLMLSLSVRDDGGREIEFDVKRDDFGGPALPESALNEMVKALSRMRKDRVE